MDNPSNKKQSSKKANLKSVGYFMIVAAILIVIVLGSYFALTVATGESDPFTIVTGPSMQPTILPGSIAIISKVPFDQLHVGDIIVFQPQIALLSSSCTSSSGGSLTVDAEIPCFIIHRVYNITGEGTPNMMITTKGDDNPGPLTQGYDNNITSNMYVGKVVLQLPYLGYLTVAPYNEYAAGLILLALIIDFLWDRKSPGAQQSSIKPELKGIQAQTSTDLETSPGQI